MNAIRPWLYIGKYRETLDKDILSVKKIDAMLQLAEAVKHPNITSIYLPVEDGVPLPEHLLQQGVDFVLFEKYLGHTVLIACGAGMSRSVVFAVAVLKEAEGLSLLEVGCGTGHWSAFFASLGYEVTGVDVSHAMIEIALSKGLQGCRSANGDGRKLQYQDESFGRVSASVSAENTVHSEPKSLEMLPRLAFSRQTSSSGAFIVAKLKPWEYIPRLTDTAIIQSLGYPIEFYR